MKSLSETIGRDEDLTEGEIDTSIGEDLLEKWEEEAKWLPADFSKEAEINSVELVICERQIDKRIVASEHTEEVELSQSQYRSRLNNLHSESEYENRKYHTPSGGDWAEGKLAYKVPDTHRETNCTECRGSGWIPCDNCGTSGEVHCPECAGTGEQEFERDCTKCNGSGYYDKESGINCSACKGTGTEVKSQRCGKCRGTGDIQCHNCGGRGEITCKLCDGEGLTHKLEILYRDCEYKEEVTHTTHGVPEEHIKDARGRHINTEDGKTSGSIPKHKIETGEIDVIEIDYSFQEPSLMGDNGEKTEFTVYFVDGEFKQNDYPKSKTRKIAPIVGAIVLIVLLIVVFFAL